VRFSSGVAEGRLTSEIRRRVIGYSDSDFSNYRTNLTPKTVLFLLLLLLLLLPLPLPLLMALQPLVNLSLFHNCPPLFSVQ